MKAVLVAALLLVAVASAQSYDPTTAMSALYYCKSSYCDASAIKPWSCDSCSDHPGVTNVNVYQNATYDSQGFTAYDSTNNQIIVAFRGTSNVKNWIADLNYKKITYPNPDCPGCEVHKGFYEVYMSMAYPMMRDVQTLASSHPSATILVTGHSLGAAVSMHAAIDISEKVTSGDNVIIYNFGEPRVGDPAFAAWAANALPQGKQFRVTHKRDPVPHLPPESFGFIHVPHELWYDNDGDTTWKNCNDTPQEEDPNCSDSVLPIDVDNHLLYLGICTECSCNSKKSN